MALKNLTVSKDFVEPKKPSNLAENFLVQWRFQSH